MLYRLIRPLIHCLPPEAAHQLALLALHYHLVPAKKAIRSERLSQRLFGLTFANPIGLAAGFDKNAYAVDGLLAQGFGFVETGTVTPLPQVGNPKPRIFRLPDDEAVINRLGFNNQGLTVYVRNFQMRHREGIVGANIGKNKDSQDASADYILGLNAVYPFADYITVNISSPNTPGLRSLQQKDALETLLMALRMVRADNIAKHGRKVPLLLKVAPDLQPAEQEDIARAVIRFEIDGIIISNTTIDRPHTLKHSSKREAGGLSGKPLFAPSTDMLKRFYRLTEGKLPLVGVGGVASADDAYAKIRAGASLVQLYTALIYQGLGVVSALAKGVEERLARDGFSHISEAIGVDAR
ncbi:MAG: quinone-dependent dihydroorotate dehydrogenase [Rickettsiales bacterium]|nr:quinone-dependent dihydroorotate dehydrogenase [Rickettsiales bacterium]